jgi:hypothetical protein
MLPSLPSCSEPVARTPPPGRTPALWQRPVGRALIIGGLVLLLAGCSALKVVYGQANTLAYWWLDRYVDFDDPQSVKVRAGLNELFRWHRSTQLGDLIQLLGRAQAQALEPTTPAAACRWFDDIQQRLNAAYDHALPAAAEVVTMLKPAQLDHLAKRYQRINEEFRDDFLQDTAEARLNASVKRTVERAEFFYGRLDDRQRALVRRGLAASPFDPEAWLAERLAMQQDVLGSLRRWTGEGAAPAVVQAGLKTLAGHAQRSPRAGYRDYQQRLIDYNCMLAAELHNATSPAQRRRAAKTLKGWEDDLRAIAAEAATR